MSASHSFSLFSRFSTFFLTQEDLQNFFDSPQVFCLSLPSARRQGLLLGIQSLSRSLKTLRICRKKKEKAKIFRGCCTGTIVLALKMKENISEKGKIALSLSLSRPLVKQKS